MICQLMTKRSCDLRGKRSSPPFEEQKQQNLKPLLFELGKSICTDSTTRAVFNLINTESVAEKTQFHFSFGLKSGSKVSTKFKYTVLISN